VSRSILIEGPGRFRLVTADPPRTEAGEALIRVAAAGICGSDRELYEGTRPEPFRHYPVVPGHEWSGTVESVGAGVDPGLVGRRVVGEGYRNCRICDRCREGDTNLCAAGYDETGFTSPGAFADHLVLPARLLHLLADDADLRTAALLEPAAVAAAIALKAAVRPGERVGVVGAGTLGLLTVQLLAAGSPGELLVSDPRAGRAPAALTSGADAFCAPSETGDPQLDVVVETAGARDSAATAAALLRRGGRLVLAGIPGGSPAGISPGLIVGSQLEISSVFGASSAAWTHAVRAYRTGLLRPAPLITHELGLTEFPEALRLLTKDGNVGKILLRPNPTPTPRPPLPRQSSRQP
jgi:threonine dehydrogenase-like Zn-dependent dehydrogenase